MAYTDVRMNQNLFVAPNGDDEVLLDNVDGSSDYVLAGGLVRPSRFVDASATGTITVGDDFISDYRYNYGAKAETWAHGGKSGGSGTFADFEAFTSDGGASGIILHEQSDTHICLFVTGGTLSAADTITGGSGGTACTLSGSNLDNSPSVSDSITEESGVTGVITTVNTTDSMLTVTHANPNSDTPPENGDYWWAWDGADASTLSGSVLTADAWNIKCRIWKLYTTNVWVVEGLRTCVLLSGEQLTKDGNDAVYLESSDIHVGVYHNGAGSQYTYYAYVNSYWTTNLNGLMTVAATYDSNSGYPCQSIIASHNADHDTEASTWAHGGVSSGPFDPFEAFTASGGATGIVLGVDGSYVCLYVLSGSVGDSDTITGDSTSAQVTLDGNPPSTNNMPSSGTVTFSNGDTGTINGSTPASDTFEFTLDDTDYELPVVDDYFVAGSGSSFAGSKITGFSDLEEGETVSDGSTTGRVSTRRKNGTYVIFAISASSFTGTITGSTSGNSVTFDSMHDMQDEFPDEYYHAYFSGVYEIAMVNRLTGAVQDLSSLNIVEGRSRFCWDNHRVSNSMFRMHSGRIYSVEDVYDHIEDITYSASKLLVENHLDAFTCSQSYFGRGNFFTHADGAYLILKRSGNSIADSYAHPGVASFVLPFGAESSVAVYEGYDVQIYPGTYGVPEFPAHCKDNGYCIYFREHYQTSRGRLSFLGDVVLDGDIGSASGEYGIWLQYSSMRTSGTLTIKNFDTTAIYQKETYPVNSWEPMNFGGVRIYNCGVAFDCEKFDEVYTELSGVVCAHIANEVFKDACPWYVYNCTFDDCGDSLADDAPIFNTEGFTRFYNCVVSNCKGMLTKASAPWGGDSDGATDNLTLRTSNNCFYNNSMSGHVKLGYTSTNAIDFTTSDSITGSSSGAQGDVIWAGVNYLLVEMTSGTFTDADSVTGSSSGATADIDLVSTAPIYPEDLDNSSDYVFIDPGTNDIYTNPLFLDASNNLYGLRYESGCCHPAGYGRMHIGALMESYGDSNNILKRIDLTGAVPVAWEVGDTLTDTTQSPNTTCILRFVGSDWVLVDTITYTRATHGDEPFSSSDTITDGTTGATIDAAEKVTWAVEDGYSTGNIGWVDVDKAGGGSNAFELNAGMISTIMTPPDDADLDSPVFAMDPLGTNQIRWIKTIDISGQESQFDTVESEEVGYGNEWGKEVTGDFYGATPDTFRIFTSYYGTDAASIVGTEDVVRTIPMRTDASAFTQNNGVIDWLKALQAISMPMFARYLFLFGRNTQALNDQDVVRGNDISARGQFLNTNIAIEGNDPREANYVQFRLTGNARI